MPRQPCPAAQRDARTAARPAPQRRPTRPEPSGSGKRFDDRKSDPRRWSIIDSPSGPAVQARRITAEESNKGSNQINELRPNSTPPVEGTIIAENMALTLPLRRRPSNECSELALTTLSPARNAGYLTSATPRSARPWKRSDKPCHLAGDRWTLIRFGRPG